MLIRFYLDIVVLNVHTQIEEIFLSQDKYENKKYAENFLKAKTYLILVQYFQIISCYYQEVNIWNL